MYSSMMETIIITAKNKLDVDRITNFISQEKLSVIVDRKTVTKTKNILTKKQLATIKGIKQGLAEVKQAKNGTLKTYSIAEVLEILENDN